MVTRTSPCFSLDIPARLAKSEALVPNITKRSLYAHPVGVLSRTVPIRHSSHSHEFPRVGSRAFGKPCCLLLLLAEKSYTTTLAYNTTVVSQVLPVGHNYCCAQS